MHATTDTTSSMESIPTHSFTTPHTSTTLFFFFNDTATTEIYTLSLHDALPICLHGHPLHRDGGSQCRPGLQGGAGRADRKSTRLNSSHGYISYAVFCLKKKKKKILRL